MGVRVLVGTAVGEAVDGLGVRISSGVWVGSAVSVGAVVNVGVEVSVGCRMVGNEVVPKPMQMNPAIRATTIIRMG